ncbi:UNVERIFIED_CONTAM: hypothetical protein GTU68_044592 [Idotea baltica]|nr:hypothetical protein [Idotea baltica]
MIWCSCSRQALTASTSPKRHRCLVLIAWARQTPTTLAPPPASPLVASRRVVTRRRYRPSSIPICFCGTPCGPPLARPTPFSKSSQAVWSRSPAPHLPSSAS